MGLHKYILAWVSRQQRGHGKPSEHHELPSPSTSAALPASASANEQQPTSSPMLRSVFSSYVLDIKLD